MTIAISVSLFLFLAFSILLGIKAHKSESGTTDSFFLANRSVSWFHLGLTIFATWFSTFAFLGVPGFIYKTGVNWLLAQVSFLFFPPLLLWFVGRKMWLFARVRGYITPGDLLSDFYSSNNIKLLSAVISIAALIPYSVIQFVGMGKVISSSTGGSISYATGVILAAMTTLIYISSGGIRAIILTDIIQGLLFLTVIVLACAATIYSCGGLSNGFLLAKAIKPEIFVFDTANIGNPISLAFTWTFGFLVLPHLWQRTYLAESASSFSKSIVLFTFLSMVFVTGVLVAGFFGAALLPSLKDTDLLIPSLFSQFIPWGLPLVVIATFAAGMSTIDSQLLTASSIITCDLAKPIFGDRLGAKTLHLIGRTLAILLIIIVATIALSPYSQGAIITLASKGTAISLLLLIPLCAPLIIKDCSESAAVGSIIFGALWLTALESKLINITLPLGFAPILPSIFFQLIYFFTLNYYSKRKNLPKEREVTFAVDVETPEQNIKQAIL